MVVAGSHMNKELRQATTRGDDWDETMDTPDLIYLVTLRAVSDLPPSSRRHSPLNPRDILPPADMDTCPREIVCSMAVSLLKNPDSWDTAAMEVGYREYL